MLKSFGASLVSTTIKGFDAPLTRGLLGAVWSWCASIQLVFQTLCSFLLLCSFASIQLVFQTANFATSAKRERLHYQQNICTQRFSAFTAKGVVNPRSSSQNQITNSHPLSNLPVTGIYTMPPGYLDLSVSKCTISQSHLVSWYFWARYLVASSLTSATSEMFFATTFVFVDAAMNHSGEPGTWNF